MGVFSSGVACMVTWGLLGVFNTEIFVFISVFVASGWECVGITEGLTVVEIEWGSNEVELRFFILSQLNFCMLSIIP